MAAIKVAQTVNKLLVANEAKKLFQKLFTALRESIAPIQGSLTGSATYDPPSLTTGVGATTTVTVTGAALGDYVSGVSFSLDLQGISVTAYVSAANTVSVRFYNGTAGTLDLASGTLRAWTVPQAQFAKVTNLQA